MKQLLTALILLSTLVFSCQQQDLEPKMTAETFQQMDFSQQIAAVTKYGFVSNIFINNITLQRVTTGNTRNYPTYTYSYTPPVDIYILSEETTFTSIGLRQGGANGQLLDVNVKIHNQLPIAYINGQKYDITIKTISQANNNIIVDFIFKPSAAVQGISNDYMNLIKGLNLSNNKDVARPELPLNDLKVLSLDNVTLRVDVLL